MIEGWYPVIRTIIKFLICWYHYCPNIHVIKYNEVRRFLNSIKNLRILWRVYFIILSSSFILKSLVLFILYHIQQFWPPYICVVVSPGYINNVRVSFKLRFEDRLLYFSLRTTYTNLFCVKWTMKWVPSFIKNGETKNILYDPLGLI